MFLIILVDRGQHFLKLYFCFLSSIYKTIGIIYLYHIFKTVFLKPYNADSRANIQLLHVAATLVSYTVSVVRGIPVVRLDAMSVPPLVYYTVHVVTFHI